MPTFQIAPTSTPGTSPFDYTSVTMNMSPDNYGTVVITHGGGRLASNSTVAYFFQGSLDGGTTWFDLETFKPADTAYVAGNTASWCKVVPLAPLVRLRALNATALAVTAWVID
jgi:hypothetical protein